MIKSLRQEHWKTVHKDILQDRFSDKASSYDRILSFVKDSQEGFLKGGKTAGYLSFMVNLKNRKKKKDYFHRLIADSPSVILKKRSLDRKSKTRVRILAKQFGVSQMQFYRVKSGENWGDISV